MGSGRSYVRKLKYRVNEVSDKRGRVSKPIDKRLTANDFISKRSGQPLTSALLYRGFFAVYDQLGFQLLKVSGHSPACTHDTVRRIFSYVDREVRKELALWLNPPNHQQSESDP